MKKERSEIMDSSIFSSQWWQLRLDYLEKEISFSCGLRFFSITILLSIRWPLFLFLLSLFFVYFIHTITYQLYYRSFRLSRQTVNFATQCQSYAIRRCVNFRCLLKSWHKGNFAFITRAYLDNLDNRRGITRILIIV